MKLLRHRIVKDTYSGYECQIWRLWFPFWMQIGWSNTHSSIDKAKAFIKDRHWTMEVD